MCYTLDSDTWRVVVARLDHSTEPLQTVAPSETEGYGMYCTMHTRTHVTSLQDVRNENQKDVCGVM